METIKRHYFGSNLHRCGPTQFLLTQCSPGKPKRWMPTGARPIKELCVHAPELLPSFVLFCQAQCCMGAVQNRRGSRSTAGKLPRIGMGAAPVGLFLSCSLLILRSHHYRVMFSHHPALLLRELCPAVTRKGGTGGSTTSPSCCCLVSKQGEQHENRPWPRWRARREHGSCVGFGACGSQKNH